MKTVILAIGCFCILALAASPAQAFTAKDLTIILAQNGDAHVTMQYRLSVPEYFAVFLRIANPAQELTRALESSLQKPVTVLNFDSTSADVIIPSFASVSEQNSTVTMATPQISFERAQELVNQYWFAALISPDFSPEVTTIAFPDGYSAGFYNTLIIPSVSHRIAGPP
jgi:hypothetical protein